MLRSHRSRAQTGWLPEEPPPPFAKKRANGTPPNLGGEFRKLDSLTSTFQPPDTSVVLDFSLTNTIEVLLELFAGRILLSDVEAELKPGLGTGELGALTVVQFRQATLVTNDKPARQVAESLGIPYFGRDRCSGVRGSNR